ncbi:MAG: hypothetical protein EOM19_01520 [Candidatus Moranbacteria bacterium]|nr:hypothetical protein [Candidatus Moranbacteria bacterium]
MNKHDEAREVLKPLRRPIYYILLMKFFDNYINEAEATEKERDTLKKMYDDYFKQLKELEELKRTMREYINLRNKEERPLIDVSASGITLNYIEKLVKE